MATTAIDLKEEILRLKKERNAVILAHNYQVGEIQDIADYVGDSLGLAYKAQATDCDVIAFCGVHFMAETAKILNPNKTVILPDRDAGCSLEESCPGPELEKYLKDNAEKNYYVIAYINCSADVKALSDCICTSGNAVKIVSSTASGRGTRSRIRPFISGRLIIERNSAIRKGRITAEAALSPAMTTTKLAAISRNRAPVSRGWLEWTMNGAIYHPPVESRCWLPGLLV